ncbi:hypothetical protein [Clostridioides difficile]|uniref:hypothetical protein n=1 Tax=Clostridioides difficile TaxID=1496 RepID=UPI001883FA32|nr:hypothetical protein [Clostridioides difficile]MDN9384663.1 hypothetical protein [Clostridioides difficile]
MKISFESVVNNVNNETELILSKEELQIAKRILNTLNENEQSILSSKDILDFCKEALKYNLVPKFI